MDVKKYLLDFTNWEKEDFIRAREKDLTDVTFYDKCNQALLDGMLAELHQYHGEKIKSSYSRFEASYREQRDYITKAMAELPADLKQQAEDSMRFSWPVLPENSPGYVPFMPIEIKNYTVTVGSHGELIQIKDNSIGRCKDVSVGLLEYETFGGQEVDSCYYGYGRNLKENYYWSEPDFGKPGLHYHKNIEHTCSTPVPVSIKVWNDTLYVFMRFSEEICEQYGCPRKFASAYQFSDQRIHMEVFWKEKDAIRSPEAVWMGMNLRVKNASLWKLNKSGSLVSPGSVRYDGNRKLHGVQSLHYASGEEQYSVYPIDSPLVSPGEKSMYQVDNHFGDLDQGFYFLLYNNRWGTNFKQWYDEDMRFVYDIEYYL